MKLSDIKSIKKINSSIILAKIIDTKGSVPREKNVFMVISSENQFGTIGGGEFEFRVTKESLKLLQLKDKYNDTFQYSLGPSLGQCCGGYIKVELIKFDNGLKLLEKFDLKNEIINQNQNLYIFGAGHVSNALTNKLDGVGFNIFVIDSREEYLKKIKYQYANKVLAKNPEIIIQNSPSESYFIVLTHSHKLDFDICSNILKKNNFNFFGLIGSQTKKIKFRKRLKDSGFKENLINKMECPIGIDSINGKEPDVIAISIIARLLEVKTLIMKKEERQLKLVKA